MLSELLIGCGAVVRIWELAQAIEAIIHWESVVFHRRFSQ